MSNFSPKRVITSLAILKVNYDENKDFIDFLVPFFMQALTAFEVSTILDPDIIRAEVFKQFQLKIPFGPSRGIINRLLRNNPDLLKKDKGNYELIKKPDNESIKGFKEKSLEVKRRHNDFILQFREYVGKNHTIILNHNEAEEALYDFLATDGLSVLQQELEPIIEISQKLSTKKNLYYMAQFVKLVINNNQVLFEHLETITKGSMLADVVYTPDLNDMPRRIKRLDVYLDTSFLLKVLGFVDIKCLVKSANEVLDLLQKLKVNCYVFPHTIREIKEILNACKEQLNQQKTKFPVWRHFHSINASRSDLVLIVGHLEEKLGLKEIFIKETPSYTVDINIDEKGLSEYLSTYFSNPEALNKDIKSLSAVFRIRRGRHYRNLNDCPALFISDNSELITQSNKFFCSKNGYFSHIPISMNSNSLMTKLWLLAPDTHDNISRNHLVANCYSLLNPTQEIWEKYNIEAQKLETQGHVSQDDITLLRSSDEVIQLVTEECSGDESEINQELICISLEKYKAQLKEPLEKIIKKLEEKQKFLYSEVSNKKGDLEEKNEEIEKLKREKENDGNEIHSTTVDLRDKDSEIEKLKWEKEENERKNQILGNRNKRQMRFICIGVTVISMLVAIYIVNYQIKWVWLLKHPNFYGLQACSLIFIACLIIGFWIKEWRKALWGSLIAILVAAGCLLGGDTDNKKGKNTKVKSHSTPSTEKSSQTGKSNG